MVTYNDATQAVRNRWVNQQRKRIDLRALLLIIAFKLDFGILDYKKTQMFLININTKYKNKSLHILHCFCISLTTEEWASKYIWRYLPIVICFEVWMEISMKCFFKFSYYEQPHSSKCMILIFIFFWLSPSSTYLV